LALFTGLIAQGLSYINPFPPARWRTFFTHLAGSRLQSGDETQQNGYRGWSGHITRVGAAIAMATKKYSTPQIMQKDTREKAETVVRYMWHFDAHAVAMVGLMERHLKK